MTVIDIDKSLETGRAKRLKAATNDTHDRLDHSIMDTAPFASRERYGLFVTVQHQFHQDIDAIYQSAALSRMLPDLTSRRRLGLIEQDLSDLGIVPAVGHANPEFRSDDDIDIPAALGWLYVSEGSNLGAAFLLKEAAKLGLSESFGARHLAAAPEGRGLHWKTFTAALDAAELTEPEEERAVAGARAAFARVQALVNSVLAQQTAT
jgi:heme oxygenase